MQKTRDTKQRKAETKKERIKYAQNKKSNSQNAKTGEKRSINDSEINKFRKRVHNVQSQIRN